MFTIHGSCSATLSTPGKEQLLTVLSHFTWNISSSGFCVFAFVIYVFIFSNHELVKKKKKSIGDDDGKHHLKNCNI